VTTVALGEVVDFYSGGTPAKANAEFWDGKIPWFSPKDLKKPRLADSADHISDAVFAKTSLRKIPAGTVAIVVRGMILAHTVPIAILDVESAINQDLKALLPRREIDASFLAAVLTAQHDSILAQVSTAAHGTKKLDSRILENIRIPLPTLHEQRRIAAILNQADSLRTKRRQVISSLNEMPVAIYNEMFGVGSGTCVNLGEIAEVKGGKRLPKGTEYSKLPTRHPYIRVVDLQGGNIATDDLRFISEEVHARIARYVVGPDDVVISIAGTIGATAAVSPSLVGANLTENAARISPRTDSVYRAPWLACALRSTELQAQIRSHVGRVTIGKLALFKIEKLKLSLPPLDEQDRFLSKLATLRTLSQSARSHFEDELFASLQSRAFRGEL
jgi:type I restriction enzyme, S subunit